MLREVINIINEHAPKSTLSIPPIPYHLASNAGFMSPDKVVIIINTLENLSYVCEVKSVRGFINIKFHDHFFQDFVFNYNSIGKGKKIHLEYASPNPTGQLHLGHLRGLIYGQCLEKLLRMCGYQVETDMYVNDAGIQFQKFLDTIGHYLGRGTSIHYIGAYPKEVATHIQDNSYDKVLPYMVDQILEVLKQSLNIIPQNIVYESKQYDIMINLESQLISKNILYIGKLPEQKSHGNLKIISASSYSSHEDFVFCKSDDQYTYAAYDCAYAMNKLQRGYKDQICIIGEDHAAHIKKISPLMKHFGIDLNAIYYGIVTFQIHNKTVTFSKRNGQIITIEDGIKSYGLDALKEAILNRTEMQSMCINLDNISAHKIFTIRVVLNNLKLCKTINLSTLMKQKICIWEYLIKSCIAKKSIHRLFEFTYDIASELNKSCMYDVPKYLYDIYHKTCEVLISDTY